MIKRIVQNIKTKKRGKRQNLFKMIRRIVQKIKTPKNGEIGEILKRPDGKKQVKSLARGSDWLGAILALGPDWLGGQIGVYLILHLVNNSTLSTCRLSQVSTFKKIFFMIKEYFQ